MTGNTTHNRSMDGAVLKSQVFQNNNNREVITANFEWPWIWDKTRLESWVTDLIADREHRSMHAAFIALLGWSMKHIECDELAERIHAGFVIRKLQTGAPDHPLTPDCCWVSPHLHHPDMVPWKQLSIDQQNVYRAPAMFLQVALDLDLSTSPLKVT